MALEDILAGQTYMPSERALPIPQSGGFSLADIVVPQQAAAKPRRNWVDTVGRIGDAMALAGGRQGNYGPEMRRREAEQAAETARLQAEARKMRQDNAFAAFRANPADRGALVDLVASGYEKGPDLYKTLNPQMSTSQGSQPREVVIAQMLADPATPQAVRDQLERLVNTPVYRGTPDGGTAALPKLAPGPTNPGDIWGRMIKQESGGRQFGADGQPLTSRAGAIGIAQVRPQTAPEAAQLAGVPFDENRYRTDPAYNEQLGRAYFQEQLRTFGDPARAAAAYNAGPGAVRQAIQQGGDNWLSRLPAETRDYVARVTGPGGRGIQAQQVVAGQPKPGFTLLSQSEVAGIPGLTPGRAYQRDGQGKISAVEGAGGKGAAARAKGLEPGKLADVEMMIRQLRLAESELEKGGVSGPIIGVTPDPLLRAANPRAVDVKETVAAVTQRNLREILGGQFAQKEGEQLINRAYNPGLPEATNLRRVRELRQAIEKRRDDLMGGGSGMVRVTSPEEAARLPAGTQFTTPDGRVMVKR